MIWWQSALITGSSIVLGWILNVWAESIKEKRQFKRFRREKAFEEIEALKSEVGIIFELATNWKAFDEKRSEYSDRFSGDYQLIGKYSKYPDIAVSARDVLHLCKLIASKEKNMGDELPELKSELSAKYRNFLSACDKTLDNLI